MSTVGGYELEALIGRGASSTVWRAVPSGGGAPVAVKRVRRPSDAAALVQEAERLAQLDHPGILRVHGTAPDGDGVALVLELADGSLAAALADGPLAPAPLAALGADLAGVLAAIHAVGIVHGDVRAANVLAARGRWCLADLGTARRGGAGPATAADDVAALAGLLRAALDPAPPPAHDPVAAELGAVLAEPPSDAAGLARLLARLVPVGGPHDAPVPTAAPGAGEPHPADLGGPVTDDLGTRPPPPVAPRWRRRLGVAATALVLVAGPVALARAAGRPVPPAVPEPATGPGPSLTP